MAANAAASSSSTGYSVSSASSVASRIAVGKDVVGRLAIVHMVIGMDHCVLAELAAQNLVRPVGDHLVGVHVKADAGAGLEHVDHELLVPLAVDHFLRRLDDRVGALGVDQAKLLVGLRRRPLHHAEGANELRIARASRMMG